MGNLLDLERVDSAGTLVVHVVRIYRGSSLTDRYLSLYSGISKSDLVEFWVWSVDWIARNGFRVLALATSYVDHIKRREAKSTDLSVTDDFTDIDLLDSRGINPLHSIHWDLHDLPRVVCRKSPTCTRWD